MIKLAFFLINFIAASLIFLIQPIAAKTALPVLGGASYIWNTTMFFFQAMLLLGYIYAHFYTKFGSLKQNSYLHIGVLLIICLLYFPVNFTAIAEIQQTGNPITSLISALFVSVGLPFLILSATSPLTQAWFASTHKEKPYMLYAASNAGSFAGLISYPFLIEPFLALKNQTNFFDYGYTALIALIIFVVFATHKNFSKPKIKKQKADEAPTINDIGIWVVLAFIPSSLLYGVTNFITTDIASFPLLWIIPLALYIISFVIVFGERSQIISYVKMIQMPCVVGILFINIIFPPTTWMAMLPHLFVFFVNAIFCHAKLYELRPKESQLTSFYIYLSLGGALGGLFNTFIAHNLFVYVAEYYIATMATLFIWFIRSKFKMRRNTKILAGIVAVAIIIQQAFPQISNKKNIFIDRNIYGTNRVLEDNKINVLKFVHGSTVHGWQSLAPETELKITSYYHPLVHAFKNLEVQKQKLPIAILGLGTGTASCFGQESQQVDIFEIDPMIMGIANKYFTFLSKCPAEKNMIIGDARIGISKEPDKKYGIILADAFSSDSVPVHLITKEAIGLYLSKLSDNGVLAVNISNRYLDLWPVLSAISKSLGVNAKYVKYMNDQKKNPLMVSSLWVFISKDKSVLEFPPEIGEVITDDSPDMSYLWTDDYSNIIRSLK